MSTPNALDVDKYANRPVYNDSQKEEIRRFAEKVQAADEATYLKEASKAIWLSAFANNNPRSAYHAMCDLSYDEAVRRGDPSLYDRAHKMASS